MNDPDEAAMFSPSESGAPVHPDDRLWRHPSELAARRDAPRPCNARSTRHMTRVLLGVTIATASVTATWWATSQMELESDEAAPVVARRTSGGLETFAATTSLSLTPMLAATSTHGFVADDSDGQIVVISVEPASAAVRAGLRSGDLILGIGKIATQSLADLSSALSLTATASSVPLTIARDGEIIALSLPLDR